MRWSDQYATGIERIDDQHKMIFKMAEDFRVALDEGSGERVYGGILEALHLYVRTHFGFEERCMAKYHCPAAQRNREAHVRFVEILTEFQQRYAVSGFDRADARNLVDTIDRWLADHICRIDVHLKQSVEKP
jgi:hemerythrin